MGYLNGTSYMNGQRQRRKCTLLLTMNRVRYLHGKQDAAVRRFACRYLSRERADI